MHFSTKRLILRPMTENDYDSLRSILQDIDTMYAWEHSFSDEECLEWLKKQQERYEYYGYGLLGVFFNGSMIGQAGITKQKLGEIWVDELGYIFKKEYWGCGYATEVAEFLKQYAFNQLEIKKLYAMIRDNNFSSKKVAIRIGMHYDRTIVKNYRNILMPHDVFIASSDKKQN